MAPINGCQSSQHRKELIVQKTLASTFAAIVLVGCSQPMPLSPQESTAAVQAPKDGGTIFHTQVSINPNETDDTCGEGMNDCVIDVFMRPPQDAKHSVDGKDHPHCYAYVISGTTKAYAGVNFFVWRLRYPTGPKYRFDDVKPVRLVHEDGFDGADHVGPLRQRYSWHIKRRGPAKTNYNFYITQYAADGVTVTDHCERNDPVIAND